MNKLRRKLKEKYKEGLLDGNSGMPRLTKEEYLDLVEAIRSQLDYEQKASMCFNTILPNDRVTCIQNDLFEPLISLIEQVTNDKDRWLSYYIWECRMGEDPRKLTINGTKLNLKDNESLWRLLTYDKKTIK